MEDMVKIFIPLLEEGTPTIRPTQAISLGQDRYKILATPDYDPEDEVWAFLPGTVVRAKWVKGYKGNLILQAIAQID